MFSTYVSFSKENIHLLWYDNMKVKQHAIIRKYWCGVTSPNQTLRNQKYPLDWTDPRHLYLYYIFLQKILMVSYPLQIKILFKCSLLLNMKYLYQASVRLYISVSRVTNIPVYYMTAGNNWQATIWLFCQTHRSIRICGVWKFCMCLLSTK